MKKSNNFYLSDDYINKLSYDLYMSNKYKKTNNKKSLFQIMNNSLTENQRKAIIMYYSQNKKLKDIAKIINVSVPTVSRMIKKSKNI
ncbi:MAG: sigma factor-like helix-turn-helix DNA-binding protein, partial [Clostridia bacterium]|nr:sigma factor-like helix-turn-helix DNA-binding protein [Clostridia bacterium]